MLSVDIYGCLTQICHQYLLYMLLLRAAERRRNSPDGVSRAIGKSSYLRDLVLCATGSSHISHNRVFRPIGISRKSLDRVFHAVGRARNSSNHVFHTIGWSSNSPDCVFRAIEKNTQIAQFCFCVPLEDFATPW